MNILESYQRVRQQSIALSQSEHLILEQMNKLFEIQNLKSQNQGSEAAYRNVICDEREQAEESKEDELEIIHENNEIENPVKQGGSDNSSGE